MVHNGIEYGIMAAYAEGMNILRHANVGKQQHAVDAETTPLRDPELYQYDFNLDRYRRGVAARQRDRVVAAGSDRHALLADPQLENLLAGFPIRARAAGRSMPRSTRGCRPMC